MYSTRLSKKNLTDVLVVLSHLAESPRSQYEPAIPDLGALLALVDAEAVARNNRTEAVKSQRLVYWSCPECGTVNSGFPMSNSDLDRRCRGIPRDGSIETHRDGSRRICGARMNVIFDESENHEDEEIRHGPHIGVTVDPRRGEQALAGILRR